MEELKLTWNYSPMKTCGMSVFALLVLVVAGSYGTPTPTLFHDAAHLQEHIRVLKVGTLDPLMKRYRFERYGNDAGTISDLEKWAETSYSKEVKELPEIASHLDFSTQLSDLIRQSHENCAWMVLWMRHIASQEALHERGVNYMTQFLELEQETNTLLLRLEVMAQNAGVTITTQLKEMHLNNPPEFENHTFRRFHHYVQLYHTNLLMNAISERFITLESHVNTVWKRR